MAPDLARRPDSDIAVIAPPKHIRAMSSRAIAKVRELEERILEQPQTPILTDHVIHGGMYARTVFLPVGIFTGVVVKAPTILILHGDVLVHLGTDAPLELNGYQVLAASAGRKQGFVAMTDTYLTMMLHTDAKTVEEAERAFTDEVDLLASHRDVDVNTITITGE